MPCSGSPAPAPPGPTFRPASAPTTTAYQRFNRWAKRGRRAAILEALGGDADLEYLLIDSTAVRARRHAAGARKKAAARPSAGRGAG